MSIALGMQPLLEHTKLLWWITANVRVYGLVLYAPMFLFLLVGVWHTLIIAHARYDAMVNVAKFNAVRSEYMVF